MKSFTTLLLISFFPSLLFAEPLVHEIQKAQTVVPGERNQLVEYIDRVSQASAEDRMKTLIGLFKQDNGLFRRVIFAYLRKSAYPADESWAYIRRFSCGFFSDACDPYFTERVFQILERDSVLTDDMVYVRAANAEFIFPQKSYMLYQQLIERQMHTPYKEECIHRLSVLALQLGKYGDLVRWCTHQGIDLSSYIPEADEHEKMVSPQGRICFMPNRVYRGHRVVLDASCATRGEEEEPLPYTYEWIVAGFTVGTQRPIIEHAFLQSGFHSVVMERAALVGDKDLFLGVMPVYTVQIKPSDGQKVPVRVPVEARVWLTPYIPSAMVDVRWKTSGVPGQTLHGVTQSLLFSEPGDYRIDIFIRVGLYVIQKEVRVCVE